MIFPSLKSLKLKQPPGDDTCKLAVTIDNSRSIVYPVHYVAADDKPPALKSKATLTASAKNIRSAGDGTGAVTVSINVDPPAPLILKVDGADVRAITLGARPHGTHHQPGGRAMETDGPPNLTLSLANLDVNVPVTVAATVDKEPENVVASKVTFAVTAQTPPPKPQTP